MAVVARAAAGPSSTQSPSLSSSSSSASSEEGSVSLMTSTSAWLRCSTCTTSSSLSVVSGQGSQVVQPAWCRWRRCLVPASEMWWEWLPAKLWGSWWWYSTRISWLGKTSLLQLLQVLPLHAWVAGRRQGGTEGAGGGILYALWEEKQQMTVGFSERTVGNGHLLVFAFFVYPPSDVAALKRGYQFPAVVVKIGD